MDSRSPINPPEIINPMQSPQRLNEELSLLQEHPHIPSISTVNPLLLHLQYHPCETNSLYKQKTYPIALSIPGDYPQSPPSLHFLEPIYHLNVGQESGEVRMAVLEDDWSPFLSLTALIESLDNVLEMPDPNYALDDDVLNLYTHDRDAYLRRVLESVADRQVRRGLSEDDLRQLEEFVNLVPPGRDTEGGLVRSLRESVREIGVEETVRSVEIAEENMRDGHEEGSKSMEKPRETGKQQQKSGPSPRANKQEKVPRQTYPDPSPLPSLSPHPTLLKITTTIDTFLQQLGSLEQQLAATRNPTLTRVLQQKHAHQLQMLQQLLQMSEQAKRKIIDGLRLQLNRM